MKTKISDLREHLFETIEALKCDKNPMPIDRAKAIAEVAGVIVESAKAEVMFIRATNSRSMTDFIPVEESPKPAIENKRPPARS